MSQEVLWTAEPAGLRPVKRSLGGGEGQLAIWGGFVLINPLQPKEFLGLTLLSDYKYL